MPEIDLYYVPTSPPCRAVMMTAYLVGVDVNLKMVDLMGGELKKPEFLKMNRQHNVPFIDDSGFYLNESRAICGYLVNQYGQKVAHLYPEDAQLRAVVDQRLNFDASELFPSFRETYVIHNFYILIVMIIFFKLQVAIAMGNGKELTEEALEPVHKALGFLDGMLKNHDYAAGNCLTIADLSLVATVSSIDVSLSSCVFKPLSGVC